MPSASGIWQTFRALFSFLSARYSTISFELAAYNTYTHKSHPLATIVSLGDRRPPDLLAHSGRCPASTRLSFDGSMSQPSAVSVTSTSTPRACPTSLRYDEPHEGGAYCAGVARTEVLQTCCARVGGKYECMKNKCYIPVSAQPAWRTCIETEEFVCTAGAGRRRIKAKLLALTLALAIAVGVV